MATDTPAKTNRTHLSLFAGVGCTDLAVEACGYRTRALAEIDPWCRDVLKARFPRAGQFADVRDVRREFFEQANMDPQFGLVSGGFPCQDLSVLGHGRGLGGDRSGLWSEFHRILDEFAPPRVLIENVAVLTSRGLNAVLWDLDRLGYTVWWNVLPAMAVGAPHLRDRIWIECVRDPKPCLDARNGGGTLLGDLRSGFGEATGVRLPKAGFMRNGLVESRRPLVTRSSVKAHYLMGMPELSPHAGCQPSLRWPTPRATANEWRTTQNAPSHGVSHGSTLAGEINDLQRRLAHTPAASSESAGNVNPRIVEWAMGLPQDWTNPDVKLEDVVPFRGWGTTPLPFTEWTVPGSPGLHRRKRLIACGNGLVPQLASVVVSNLLAR